MLPWRLAALAGALLALGAGATIAQQEQRPQPTFRTRTTLRAIEVRVVDERGRPITDLRQQDFAIEENGKPQGIKVFTPFELAASAPTAQGGPVLAVSGTRRNDLFPSTRRVFLILLGRGNLQVPSRGIDGMIHLVRNLLPQDLVAVMAWNRATPFTTDRSRSIALLERYRDAHQKIEAMFSHYFRGMTAIYGSRDTPDSITKEIDAVLRGPDAPPTQTVLSSGASTAAVEERINRDIAVLQGTAGLDVFAAEQAAIIGMSLDEYVSRSTSILQDLERIHSAIAYLRHMEGNKHIVFVTEQGIGLPAADDDRGLGRVAQDAGIALNVFKTDGMTSGAKEHLRWQEMWSIASSQSVAEFTGGQYTGVTYGEQFAARLEAATRSGYLLGYAPSDPNLDGKHRKITIKVSRRGATVLYQHGYFARDEFTKFDRRAVISQSRVEAALRHPQPVNDLQLTVSATPGRSADGRRQLTVQVNVDPKSLQLNPNLAFERVASVDVAVVCVDRGQVVGQVWARTGVTLDDQRYAKFLESGLGFSVIVPVQRAATMLKAVVYDYTGDRVGSAMLQLK